MKNKIITEGKEALERTLLMMKYDMKKTLTENVEVILEQSTPEKDIKDKIFSAAAMAAGTDEEGLRDAIKQITSKDLYNKVNKEIAADSTLSVKYKNDPSIVGIMNDELGRNDLEVANEIGNHLKTIGLNMVVTARMERDKMGNNAPSTTYFDNIKLSTEPVVDKAKSETTLKKSDAAIKAFASFSCVSNHPKAKESKMANGSPVFFIDGEVYYNNGRKKDKSGKMVSFTCNDAIFKTSGGKKSVPSITDKNLLSKLDFSYKFPGDEKYVYAYSSPENALKEQVSQAGKWYGKNIATGKVFDITTNYPSTAAKLNSNFFTSGKAEPAAQTTQTTEKPAENTLTDVNDIKSKGLKVEPVSQLKQPVNVNLQTKTTPQTQTPQKTDMSKFDTFGPSNPEVKESLKKSLKKNLIEAKEKQEDLMVENKIITNRFNFLFEGRSFETEKEKDYLVESVITEIGYLKTQGYSSRAINEGLFSMLGNIFGGSVKSIPAVFGEYIAGWLTKTLGIPQNSYMGSVVVALVGNLNIADYDKFFSDCRFASNKIADSLIEGYVLQLQNEKNLNTGASGFIVSALRNSVVDYFTEDKSSLIQILEDKIGEFLCPKLSKLSSAISDKTDDLKSKIVA
jgi:hypothetical protein